MNLLRLLFLLVITTYATKASAWDKYLWHGSSFLPFSPDTALMLNSERGGHSIRCADLDIRQADFTLSTAITDLSHNIRQHHSYGIMLIGAGSDTLRISITPQSPVISDDISEETLRIEIRSNRTSSPLAVKEITFPKVHISGHPNQFNISRRGSNCSIGVGSTDNAWQFTATDIFPADITSIGYETSGACSIDIPRIALSTSIPFLHHGKIEPADVDSILRKTTDKKAAYWAMLDYSLDSNALLPGGQYKIAIIPAPDAGYDIIYMAGADMHTSDWQPGMIKGHLSPTSLPSLFNLTWYDVRGQRIDQYATLQFDPTGKLFTITFPMRASTIRFHKLPRTTKQ